MTPAERLLECLEGVKGTGKRRWQARCPAHDDHKPSLTITEKSGGDVLAHCHAGCALEEVLAAVDLATSDLFAEARNGNGHGHREISATYDYVDEDGELLFQVVRFAPKDFRQRRPDGNGGWDWKVAGTRRVLYRLPNVIAAVETGYPIYLVEGEKDVHALTQQGCAATCNPGGAGKWRQEYAEVLRGADVIVVADRDKPGRAHAREVARSLNGIAKGVRNMEPPNGKDVAEYLAGGGRVGRLTETETSDPVEGGGDFGPLHRLDVTRMVREQPPPIPWVVEGLVVRGMLTVLNGREGEGKSLLAMALAAGVASDQDEAGFVCHPGKALIVDSENGRYEIHRRVRTLDLPGKVEVFEAESFDLRTDLDALDELLEEHTPDLLVLDSFRSLWAGKENDSGEVAAVLDPLRNLVRRYNAGALLLHHSGKGIGGDYRGSSAIGASCELGFKLAREPEDQERDRRYLHCWKCRPAPEPARRWLRLATEGGRVFVDRAEPLDHEEPDAPAQMAPVREELRPLVLNALNEAPKARADIARACGRDPKDRSVGRVLEALRDEGLAVVEHGEPGHPDHWRKGVAATPAPIGERDPATPSANPHARAENGGGNDPAAPLPFATPSEQSEAERIVAKFGGQE